jgi:SAM-dependent methyltransferase
MIEIIISQLRFLYRVFGEKSILYKAYKNIVVLIFTTKKFSGLDQLKDMNFYVKKLSKDLNVNERAIEYPWVISRTKNSIGQTILDVGCRKGLPSTDLLCINNNVFGIEPDITESITNSDFTILKGDIRATNFQDSFFDLVLIISTLEHIGLKGRYHLQNKDDTGDFKAMTEISRILKTGGRVLGTVPYGCGSSLPLNRLYTLKRLTELFANFQVNELNFFKYYKKYGLWLEVDEVTAASNNWDTDVWYSLACFSLQKK